MHGDNVLSRVQWMWQLAYLSRYNSTLSWVLQRPPLQNIWVVSRQVFTARMPNQKYRRTECWKKLLLYVNIHEPKYTLVCCTGLFPNNDNRNCNYSVTYTVSTRNYQSVIFSNNCRLVKTNTVISIRRIMLSCKKFYILKHSRLRVGFLLNFTNR